MNETNVEALIAEIAAKSGRTETDVKGLVQEKVTKFSGLLTEQGAVFLVQKELGLRNETYESVALRDLTDGMKGIEIKGRVEAVYPAKEFDKGGKKGKLKSCIISDGTGEVRLTLWNDQVDAYAVTRGSEIKISNAIISTYNDKKQAALGFNAAVTVVPPAAAIREKLADLKAGMTGVTVTGRIVRKFPIKEFSSGERKGKLCSFQIGDGTALLRATAWNDTADALDKFGEGTAIDIGNAYTKDGRYGVELHLGYTAELAESTAPVPALTELARASASEKSIAEVREGENAIIGGKIISVERGNFAYDVCSTCGKKVTRTEHGVLCETCGETTPRKNAVVSFLIEDASGAIRINLFGVQALKALGLEQAGLEALLNEKTTDVIAAELNGRLAGQPLKVIGYAKTSSFSGAKEFTARDVY